jgi:lysyl-tRNA synthetase class 2
VDYIVQVSKDSGLDITDYGPNDADRLRADIQAAGHSREGMDTQSTPTLIDYLYKKVTRPQLVGPAFVYNYPASMQPLARPSDADPSIVEQFQLVVNGREITKAYSELVDPQRQAANFAEQASDDVEATAGDDEFVRAMEYGMPPQSGRGMGLDRILAMLTGQTNIRDVIMFPIMKLESGESDE